MLLLFNFNTILLKAQTFEWAKRAGSYAFDFGYGICNDDAGNIYMAGKYELNANFSGTTVSCKGNHDVFIAKYNPAGNLSWVRTAGGTIGDYAHAVTCDPAGTTYVTGEIETTCYFGSTPVKSKGGNDGFLARYDTNGNLQWVKGFGGKGNEKGLGVTTIGGDVYVTGHFTNTAFFNGVAITSSGNKDIYIAKYNAAGVFQWVKKGGGSGDDQGSAISSDKGGNIYVTGSFVGTANFSGVALTSSGGTDAFIAKYNSNGNLVWLKKAGGPSNDYGNGIAADPSGRIILTGGCRGKSKFGSLSLSVSGGNADMYVASYDPSGNAIWVQKAGGKLNDYGRAVAVDGSSNIYITGHYGNTAAFGTTSITAPDSSDIYIASYNASGAFRWVMKEGGGTDDFDHGRFPEQGLAITVDKSGNVYTSGSYRSNSSFGNTTLTKYNHTDIFITKIRQSSTTIAPFAAKVIPQGKTTICEGEDVELVSNADTSYLCQWMKDGIPIPGAITTVYRSVEPGNYQVKAIKGSFISWSAPTIIKGCSQKDSITQIVAITGISREGTTNLLSLENADVPQVKVYPNPNNGQFTVELNLDNNAEESITIEVVDAVGHLVYLREPMIARGFIQETIELDKELPTGMYILIVMIGNRTENTRMMLTK